ncbi:TIGR02677 family protein [Quadrisphaera sp. GCM10027208]|uniref:TIGR02677 family protein n=1 Tax=Quadrisphaera sp. GCM10027208 TaxID=3273423 RepID=UPI00361080D2
MSQQLPPERLGQDDRVRLEALRYAVNEEAASYLAIMRTFTGAIAGLLSDQSAAEVAQRLAEQGLELDVDTVDARLSYLVEHGNLARSPRETEARSLRDYLANRARYQLTQRGELVQRQVEELLQHTDTAHEVSTEMLGGILDGLRRLRRDDAPALAAADPDDVARRIGTVFAQFERLVESTREFYTYLSQVLVRYDLDRDEYQAFKTALLDYLQRFVEEVARRMPQIAEELTALRPLVPALTARANAGSRLMSLDGRQARRARGLDPRDWDGLHSWFVGTPGRDADADGVRRLATEAMRALLVNLRRIAASSDRERSRYADLLRLAGWFDEADDATAHALWAAAFGLYSCRHLAFPADDDADPVPATASWWRTPVAEVPVTLRQRGERKVTGRSGRREDFTDAKRARLAERQAAERRRAAALAEVARHSGEPEVLRISDDARAALLEVLARALTGSGPALGAGGEARADATASTGSQAAFRLTVRRTPGRSTTIASPEGRLVLSDLTLSLTTATDVRTGRQEVSA